MDPAEISRISRQVASDRWHRFLQVLVAPTPLLGRHRLDRGFLDGFEDLFDNLRVKRRVA